MAEGEIILTEPVPASAVELLNRSEIDMQVATARKFPRSIQSFQRDAGSMVTLSEEVAQECFYMLKRSGTEIMGPSARFAEIILSCWGNSRAAARVVAEDGRFVTAQGVFHDLQRNVAVNYETKRRITDRNGKTYSDDMVGVTANAACAIAIRNAVLKGIPKAFWSPIYGTALKAARGDTKTLPSRRDDALKAFGEYGISEAEVFKLAGVKGKADIDLDKLFSLSGILTALRDGDTARAELLKEIAPSAPQAPNAPAAPKAAAQNGEPMKPPAQRAAPAAPKSDGPTPRAERQRKGSPQAPSLDLGEIAGKKAPAAKQEPRDAGDPPRQPEEVIKEYENVVTGIMDPAELADVEAEYLAMEELDFPADRNRVREITREQTERIEQNS